MCARNRALILPYPFELLPAGAVRLDMRAVRLMGGVVADQVVRGGVIYHLITLRFSRDVALAAPMAVWYIRLLGAKYPLSIVSCLLKV